MIYLYGAGGHAKVIIDILESCGKTVTGIFDDDPLKVIWNFSPSKFPGSFNFSNDELVISIGNNKVRERISKIEATYLTAVHPSAIISKYVTIGKGTVIMGGALVNADTRIGGHCIINSHASVDHDCILQDFVHISPNATLCGGVSVGQCSHIGSGAIVIPGKRIGDNTVIGAGAVVISDIPDNAVAVGNPAHVIKTSY